MKKRIKINTDYLSGWTRKYYLALLSERYDLVECADPEYLLVGIGNHCLGDNLDRMANGFLVDFPRAKVRIFLQHEAVGFDFTLFDYAVLFTEKVTLEDRFFFSNFFSSGYFASTGYDLMERLLCKPEPDALLASKKKFCCFQYSHGRGVPERAALFDCLGRYRRVDSLGKFLNNTVPPSREHFARGWFQESVDVKRPYRFTIACENALHPNGYNITEKIAGAMLANTIPIYWGCPRVGEYFNSRAIINCHDYSSFDEVVSVVKEIDADDARWCEMMREPWLSRQQCLEYTANRAALQQFLFSIFDKPIEQAIRRPRGLWVERYQAAKRQIVIDSRAFSKLSQGRGRASNRPDQVESPRRDAVGQAAADGSASERASGRVRSTPPAKPTARNPAAPTSRQLRSLLPGDGPVVVEVGASSGYKSAWLQSLFCEARLFCFEPDERARAKWSERMGASRARLFDAALSDRDGVADFYASGGEPPWERERGRYPLGWDQSGSLRRPTRHLVKYPWCTFRKTTVPTLKLDTWVRMLGISSIDLLWGTAQGAERELLRGASETLARTRYLVLGCSEYGLYHEQPTLDGLLAELPTFDVVEHYKKCILLQNRACELPLKADLSAAGNGNR